MNFAYIVKKWHYFTISIISAKLLAEFNVEYWAFATAEYTKETSFDKYINHFNFWVWK